MVMIVLCHIIKFYTFIPGSQIYGEFFNVGVEVFLLLSGFLYGKKNIRNFKSWICKRVKRIWVPVLVVVLIDTIVLAVVFNVHTNWITEISYIFNLQGILFINWDFFRNYVTEITNLGPLWFMTIIMICYLMLPLIQNFKNRHTDKKNKKFIYLAWIIALFLISLFLQLTTKTVTFYFIVFLVGYLLSDLKIDESEFSRIKTMIYILIVPIMVALRVVLRYFIDGTVVYTSLINIFHSIMGISLMCLGLELYKCFTGIFDKVGHSKIFVFLDGASVYIYLVHGIFCMGVMNVYDRFSITIATVVFAVVTLICAKVLWIITDTINAAIKCRY